MKTGTRYLLLALTLGTAVRAGAVIYTVNPNATIPDGDLNGYQNSQTLSGFSAPITHVSVNLNISGGFNGDLYAYVSHNSTTAVLLNRVGRSSTSGVGYPTAGFGPDASANSFTLDDQAGHDVHLYQAFSFSLNGSGQLTGQWQPDGRGLSPLSAGSLFDSAPRSNMLSGFNGMDANGSWSLFISDVSPGGESTLVSWSLAVSVPEPSSAAFLVLGLSSLAIVRRKGKRT